jgi:toxin CptA
MPGIVSVSCVLRPLCVDTQGWGASHKVWSPHAATVIIGICCVVTLLLTGRWTYTDMLAEPARGMVAVTARLMPMLLLAALFGGALIGWSSLLPPGSNDSLLLVGLPLLRPHACLAFLAMVLSITAAILAGQAWIRRRSGTVCSGEA